MTRWLHPCDNAAHDKDMGRKTAPTRATAHHQTPKTVGRPAMAHWLDHAGRYTIRGSIVATRQPGDSPLEVQAIYDILCWHTKKTED